MNNKPIKTIRVNKVALMGCSQSPHDVTTASLRLVKNVVGLQKSDQELRVSYKPTAFRRWVVDDQLSRYNARQSSFDALYGMDNIVAQIWIIARNVRNKLEEGGILTSASFPNLY